MSIIQTHIPEVGGSSEPSQELAYKVTYEQIWMIRPIIRSFFKSISLHPISHNIPHHPKKKETTRTGVLVASVEDLVFSTLEELAVFRRHSSTRVASTHQEEYKEGIVLSDRE